MSMDDEILRIGDWVLTRYGPGQITRIEVCGIADDPAVTEVGWEVVHDGCLVTVDMESPLWGTVKHWSNGCDIEPCPDGLIPKQLVN